jgi:hypothetical protein
MAVTSRPEGLRYKRWLIVLFIAAISLPLASNLAGFDGADPEVENRELARFPVVDGSWQSIAGFGAGLSEWFTDHFGFRARLIRWYGESRLFGLGVSPTADVVKGRDGFFFYGDDKSLNDYTNDLPLTAAQVNAWRESCVDARDWLRTQGIGYVVMIAPDKHVIYPEEMPASITPIGSVSRTDQVLAALQAAGVASVDVRAELLAAKSRERLYEETDTHWNDRGAFIAYEKLITEVRRQVPAAPPAWPDSDFERVTARREGMDLAGMMGLTRVMQEDELQLIPKRHRRATVVEPAGGHADDEVGRVVTTVDDPSLPRALVFRDSFFSRLAPFAAEHFSRMTMLWQNDFDADAVVKERPAIVIQEIVGRHLYTFEPSPELIPK